MSAISPSARVVPPNFMKRSLLGFCFVLVLGAGLGFAGAKWYAGQGFPLSYAQKSSTPAAPGAGPSPATAAPPPAPAAAGTAVEVAPVRKIAFQRVLSAVGSLRSENSVMLRSEVAGRIAAINFEQGGKVRKGDLLIQLDDSVVKAQLLQAQASLSLAQSRYRRAQELSREGFISKQARDEAASELKVQDAAVALNRAQLDKTAILAPFDGLIGLRNVSVGDYISPGQDLVPIESVDPLNVDFRIPEQFLNSVYPGLKLGVTFDALPGQVRDGQVRAISPVVDVGGRSLLLRATIPNADDTLRPGMFARVSLQLRDDQVLAIPETALAPSGDTQYVYRVQDGVARRVAVRIGMRRDAMVEITQGLQPDDVVVVSGLQKVSDGSRVNVVSAPGTVKTSN